MGFIGDMAGPIAADLIQTMGQPVTITKVTPGSYDPTAGQDTGGSTTTEDGYGAVVEYPISVRSKGGDRDETGGLVLTGDRSLLLSPQKTDGTALAAPVPGDKATVGGKDFTITAVAPQSPDGTAVYYECNIRGAKV